MASRPTKTPSTKQAKANIPATKHRHNETRQEVEAYERRCRTASANAFLHHPAFTHLIRVNVAAPQTPLDETHGPHAFVAWVAARICAFCAEHVQQPDGLDLGLGLDFAVWPRLFVVCGGDAREALGLGECRDRDAQDRGSFVVGVCARGDRGPPAEGREPEWAGPLRRALGNWMRGLPEEEFFQANFETLVERGFKLAVAASVVPRAKALPLVPDEWVWEAAGQVGPLLYCCSGESPQLEALERDVLDAVAGVRRTSPPAQSAAVASVGAEAEKQPRLEEFMQIMNRLRHDVERFDFADYEVMYWDGVHGYQECDPQRFFEDSTNERNIPGHRCRYIQNKKTLEIVWHRGLKLDRISRS